LLCDRVTGRGGKRLSLLWRSLMPHSPRPKPRKPRGKPPKRRRTKEQRRQYFAAHYAGACKASETPYPVAAKAEKKKCVICGKSFTAWWNRRTCSPAHQKQAYQEARRKRAKEYYLENQEAILEYKQRYWKNRSKRVKAEATLSPE
jgi:hypothetical protein